MRLRRYIQASGREAAQEAAGRAGEGGIASLGEQGLVLDLSSFRVNLN